MICRVIILSLSLLTFWFGQAQQLVEKVGDNATLISPSAALEVESSTKGFLPPRMTYTQRDAIVSPIAGLMVLCVDCGDSGELQVYNGTTWTNLVGGIASLYPGTIASLNCAGATHNGTLAPGSVARNVSSIIAYTGTGANGGFYNGQSVTSTGVTGLTATLTGGILASGTGTLTYTITGTPSSAGTASFAISVAGQSCTLTRVVSCPASITFTYNGASVSYGVVSSSGKCWLDRNLGATRVATSSTDAASYGDLFQWGRGADGHQIRTSSTSSTLSSTDTPGSSFITTSVLPNDWRSPKNDNLWQGVNGINNPCPSGFRIPTEVELNTERLSWSSNNAAGAFGSPLKLTLTGYRNINGSLIGVNSSGYYNSSTVTNNSIRALNTNPGSTYGSARAYGLAVRCIMD